MFTHTLDEAQVRRLRELVGAKGFVLGPLEHGHFTARKGKCVISAYLSGKLVVAGKEAKEFVEFVLEPEVLGEARLGYEKLHNPEMYAPHFGIDESGKGDLFGPLVVAGVYVDEEKAERLIAAGVRDSKTITSDKKIGELAEEIGKVVGPGLEVVTIGPERYSELYRKFGNLNRMLAWAHGKVIANLHGRLPDCPRALSDQFGDPRLVEGGVAAAGCGVETGATNQGRKRHCGGGGQRAGEGGVCPAVGEVVDGSGDSTGQGIRRRGKKAGGGDLSKERKGKIGQTMQNSLPHLCGSRWGSGSAKGGMAQTLISTIYRGKMPKWLSLKNLLGGLMETA